MHPDIAEGTGIHCGYIDRTNIQVDTTDDGRRFLRLDCTWPATTTAHKTDGTTYRACPKHAHLLAPELMNALG